MTSATPLAREITPSPDRGHHVTVCICTFRRPELLARLLQALSKQRTGAGFTYSIVVADNDSERSSQQVVTDFAGATDLRVVYSCEPRQNIALARNEALRHAQGDFVAFIDDDEFPDEGWLKAMLGACESYGASGILGPVRPHFDKSPPDWILKGRFCERPEHPTGRIMSWHESRTGNFLFRREILNGVEPPFEPAFGTGGEDVDFFLRMARRGCAFRWCNEGVVYETVPRERWTRAYMLRRAMLRGRNILKLPVNRASLLARSLVAAPIYLVMLPATLFLGQHVFMKYCIKFCDHAGRILTMLGLNPVRDR